MFCKSTYLFLYLIVCLASDNKGVIRMIRVSFYYVMSGLALICGRILLCFRDKYFPLGKKEALFIPALSAVMISLQGNPVDMIRHVTSFISALVDRLSRMMIMLINDYNDDDT